MLKTKKRSVSFFRVNDSENERERGKRKREGRTACLEREREMRDTLVIDCSIDNERERNKTDRQTDRKRTSDDNP